MHRNSNPCYKRLIRYKEGELVVVTPALPGATEFYQQVIGGDVGGEVTSPTVMHFIGWGVPNRDPNQHPNPFHNYVVRVVEPYGKVHAVTCCQIARKAGPLESMTLAQDMPRVMAGGRHTTTKSRLSLRYWRNGLNAVVSYCSDRIYAAVGDL